MRKNRVYKGICMAVSVLLIVLSIYLLSTVSLRREPGGIKDSTGMEANASDTVVYDNREEFEQQLGIEVKDIVNLPFEATDITYTLYSAGSYKIEYTDEKNTVTFYKASKERDIIAEAAKEENSSEKESATNENQNNEPMPQQPADNRDNNDIRYISKDDYTLITWKSEQSVWYGIKSKPGITYDDMVKMTE